MWIPSHIGIKGNDAADKAAGEASLAPLVRLPFTTLPDIKPLLGAATMASWTAHWEALPPTKLHAIQQTPQPCSLHLPTRRDEVVLTRLRLGHTRLTHSHLFTHDPPPDCPTCHCPLTVSHILLSCPRYTTERAAIPLPHTLTNLLTSNPNPTLSFLHNADLYDHI